MKILLTHSDGSKHLLSNEGLKTGDRVYPLADGLVNDGEFFHIKFDLERFLDGPHIILNLKHSPYKPYEIQTDHGYGPVEKYYKMVKENFKFSWE